MSRYTADRADGTWVAYGLDHALGWFCDSFDAQGEIIKEECTLFTGLGRAKLVTILKTTDAPKAHISAIALDLDPGDPQGDF